MMWLFGLCVGLLIGQGLALWTIYSRGMCIPHEDKARGEITVDWRGGEYELVRRLGKGHAISSPPAGVDKVRRFRARKVKEHAEHYARSDAAKMGLKGVKIKVFVEDVA